MKNYNDMLILDRMISEAHKEWREASDKLKYDITILGLSDKEKILERQQYVTSLMMAHLYLVDKKKRMN